MAVPPLADTPMSVKLAIEPPSTVTGPPQVSPTPIALPALPPLFTSPRETAPPFALAVATPPLPADAMSPAPASPPPKNLSWIFVWAAASAAARTPAAAAIAAAFIRRVIDLPPPTPKSGIVPQWQPRRSGASPHPHDSQARYHRSHVLSMIATHPS